MEKEVAAMRAHLSKANGTGSSPSPSPSRSAESDSPQDGGPSDDAPSGPTIQSLVDTRTRMVKGGLDVKSCAVLAMDDEIEAARARRDAKKPVATALAECEKRISAKAKRLAALLALGQA